MYERCVITFFYTENEILQLRRIRVCWNLFYKIACFQHTFILINLLHRLYNKLTKLVHRRIREISEKSKFSASSRLLNEANWKMLWNTPVAVGQFKNYIGINSRDVFLTDVN
uniref:Uncharacterized protein n=1 Tax=Octopus bimaculoides TaxID=37653 RepID=A0A0L8G1F4_OCTBM